MEPERLAGDSAVAPPFPVNNNQHNEDTTAHHESRTDHSTEPSLAHPGPRVSARAKRPRKHYIPETGIWE